MCLQTMGSLNHALPYGFCWSCRVYLQMQGSTFSPRFPFLPSMSWSFVQESAGSGPNWPRPRAFADHPYSLVTKLLQGHWAAEFSGTASIWTRSLKEMPRSHPHHVLALQLASFPSSGSTDSQASQEWWLALARSPSNRFGTVLKRCLQFLLETTTPSS